MHDTLNTLDGRFGFVAVYPGGRRIAEDAATWDEIPRDEPLLSLDFVDFKRASVVFSLDGYERFFFVNECVHEGLRPRLTAKIFGGTNKGQGAVIVRVDFTGPTVRMQRQDVPEHRFAPHALRPGLVVT
jgi:hypothetical protein